MLCYSSFPDIAKPKPRTACVLLARCLYISVTLTLTFSHTSATMPPTPQAVAFVFAELWSPAQTEAFICHFWPPGVAPGHLRALLSHAPFDQMPYMDHLIDIGTWLVMAGHQRSLLQILQEMGVVHAPGPLPPMEVNLFPTLVSSVPSLFLWSLNI